MFSHPMDPGHLLHRHPGRVAAAPRRRTGRRCSSACTCATASARATGPRCSRSPRAKSPGIKSASIKVERRLRVRLPAHRGRRAPARAQEPVRFERAPAHVVRERLRLPGSRRLDRGRHQSGRPAHRHLPRVGRRRPAHQQDRLRGAHHAPADQHRRPVPERPLAAPQPRRGDGDAEVEALRARAPQAPGRAAEARGLEDRHRLGPPDPLATCSTSRGSRTCARTTRSATRRRSSTATSTTSSRRA